MPSKNNFLFNFRFADEVNNFQSQLSLERDQFSQRFSDLEMQNYRLQLENGRLERRKREYVDKMDCLEKQVDEQKSLFVKDRAEKRNLEKKLSLCGHQMDEWRNQVHRSQEDIK